MGFVVLFFGILIFNEILILPVFKMQKETRYERLGSPNQSPYAGKRTLEDGKVGKISVEFVEEEDENGMSIFISVCARIFSCSLVTSLASSPPIPPISLTRTSMPHKKIPQSLKKRSLRRNVS